MRRESTGNFETLTTRINAPRSVGGEGTASGNASFVSSTLNCTPMIHKIGLDG
jgi:hypothetical protein